MGPAIRCPMHHGHIEIVLCVAIKEALESLRVMVDKYLGGARGLVAADVLKEAISKRDIVRHRINLYHFDFSLHFGENRAWREKEGREEKRVDEENSIDSANVKGNNGENVDNIDNKEKEKGEASKDAEKSADDYDFFDAYRAVGEYNRICKKELRENDRAEGLLVTLRKYWLESRYRLDLYADEEYRIDEVDEEKEMGLI
ncbi:hypothetical protein F4782DRAFT_550316 [Xylaria castorea]|nr:hypothetical protein F4782DRAFT_550316 [Xylaria castorea]